MEIDIKKAVPFGIILNELITNAIKYVYTPGMPGVIRIELKHQNGNVILRFSNDGVGIGDKK